MAEGRSDQVVAPSVILNGVTTCVEMCRRSESKLIIAEFSPAPPHLVILQKKEDKNKDEYRLKY